MAQGHVVDEGVSLGLDVNLVGGALRIESLGHDGGRHMGGREDVVLLGEDGTAKFELGCGGRCDRDTAAVARRIDCLGSEGRRARRKE